ncbi:MAG TPA: TlpA family protein disulfide reductase [Minicystis sp.]|nr:TlpA family protein disulfide reductase [Minicystis sp.]
MRNALFVVATSLFVLGSVGCGSTDVTVPSFQKGQGQAPQTGEAYPAGPYGINVGSVVENYHFVGYVNYVADHTDGMQEVQLADFYNPHADDPNYDPGDGPDDRVFPDGSPYGAGTPKPKALLIDVSSVWCPPCNDEAHYSLPGKYSAYKPQGGEFLLNLADGPNPGTSATPDDLTTWTNEYHEEFPAVIDPEYKLAALFAADFFPANMVVNPRNMKICKVVSGAPDQSTWNLYGDVLVGKETCD